MQYMWHGSQGGDVWMLGCRAEAKSDRMLCTAPSWVHIHEILVNFCEKRAFDKTENLPAQTEMEQNQIKSNDWDHCTAAHGA